MSRKQPCPLPQAGPRPRQRCFTSVGEGGLSQKGAGRDPRASTNGLDGNGSVCQAHNRSGSKGKGELLCLYP